MSTLLQLCYNFTDFLFHSEIEIIIFIKRKKQKNKDETNLIEDCIGSYTTS